MDEKEPLHEHLAERRECAGGLSAQSNQRGRKAPGVDPDDRRSQANGQLLDQCTDATETGQKETKTVGADRLPESGRGYCNRFSNMSRIFIASLSIVNGLAMICIPVSRNSEVAALSA